MQRAALASLTSILPMGTLQDGILPYEKTHPGFCVLGLPVLFLRGTNEMEECFVIVYLGHAKLSFCLYSTAPLF